MFRSMFPKFRTKSGYVLILVASLFVVAVQACNDQLPTMPETVSAPVSGAQAPSALTLGGVLTTLQSCLKNVSSVAVDIGPAGGSISLCGNTLVVPALSLTSVTHVIMVPSLDHAGAVQFFPEGLQFSSAHKPTLTLSTDPVGNPANAYIVYTDDQGKVKEVETTTARTAHSVSAQIGHFSRYAVDW